MYAGTRYAQHPDRAAFIMASAGETVTYGEHEQRTNRLAHLLRAEGLKRLDHYAILMENNSRYLESCGAGERSGLYYTCINSYLTVDELAYIVQNCEAELLFTSAEKDLGVAELLDFLAAYGPSPAGGVGRKGKKGEQGGVVGPDAGRRC